MSHLGKVGGIFGDNCAVLFFILVFLYLFAGPGFGVGGAYREE